MAISCVSAADCEDKIRSIKEERRGIVTGYRITAGSGREVVRVMCVVSISVAFYKGFGDSSVILGCFVIKMNASSSRKKKERSKEIHVMSVLRVRSWPRCLDLPAPTTFL